MSWEIHVSRKKTKEGDQLYLIRIPIAVSNTVRSGLHNACRTKIGYGPKSVHHDVFRYVHLVDLVDHILSISLRGLVWEFSCERTRRIADERGTCMLPMMMFVISRNQRERGKMKNRQVPSILLKANSECHTSERFGTGSWTNIKLATCNGLIHA